MMSNFLLILVASGDIWQEQMKREWSEPVSIERKINKYLKSDVKYTYEFRRFFFRGAKHDQCLCVCGLSRAQFSSLYLFVLCFRPIVPSGSIEARTSQSAKFIASSGISDWVNDFSLLRLARSCFSFLSVLSVSLFFRMGQSVWSKREKMRTRKKSSCY